MKSTAPRVSTHPASRTDSGMSAEGRRSARRERAFGTGYGRSSGYADGLRRYAETEYSGRFRIH